MDSLDLDNVTGIVTIIAAACTILGSLAVVVRTLLLLFRDASAAELGVERSSSEGSKGARKLRRVLVAGLTMADLLIAIGIIGPAAVGLAGQEASKPQCEAQGFILATAMWWQYGFSFCIALTTLIGLRYPLSRWKAAAERHLVKIVIVVLLVGGAQAAIWKVAHGYEEWHDLCLYGSPLEVGDELMQTLPRLIFSLITASCYIPLLFFLRRPDPGALYLSPRPTSALSLSPSTDTLPPWERLSFPNFSIIEKGTYSFSPKLGSFEEEPKSEEEAEGDGSIPSKRFSFHLRPRSSTFSSLPVAPRAYPSSLRTFHFATNEKTNPPFDREVVGDETQVMPFTLESEIRDLKAPTSLERPADEFIPRSPAPLTAPAPVSALKVRPTLVVDTRKSNRARFEEGIPSPLSPMTPLSASGTAAPISANGRQRSNTIPASLELEVSFSTMLSYIPPAPLPTSISAPLMSAGWSSHSRNSSNGSTLAPHRDRGRERDREDHRSLRSRSGTPDVRDNGGGGAANRSMASEVNRRTLKFLIWFPIAHCIIFFFVLTRAILLAATQQAQTVPVALLTLGTITIQGVFDIFIFGLVERRFRDSIAEATTHPDDSLSFVESPMSRWKRTGWESCRQMWRGRT